MANLARTWRPKRLQNRGQDAKKSMLKTNTFWTSILEGFRHRFGRVFEKFLKRKTDENCESSFFAKPLKLLIFLREIDVFKVPRL